MVRAEKIIDIDEHTNLVALTEDVQASGETAVLQRNGKPVAKLVPVAAKKPRSRRPRGMSVNDPIWDLVGMATGDGPSDVSENHDKYLADYYYSKGHQP